MFNNCALKYGTDAKINLEQPVVVVWALQDLICFLFFSDVGSVKVVICSHFQNFLVNKVEQCFKIFLCYISLRVSQM